VDIRHVRTEKGSDKRTGLKRRAGLPIPGGGDDRQVESNRRRAL